MDWAEDEIVLDSTHGNPVRDFLAEEEEQPQEAWWNNELMFHAEVEQHKLILHQTMRALQLIKIHLCMISRVFPFCNYKNCLLIRNIKCESKL